MRKPNKPPLVSICCVTYNHAKYIAEALDSFLMQKTDFDFEIIVGEDKSTDGTRDVVERYAATYPNQISVIQHDPNVGAIRNQLATFAMASGQYIAICDGDDFWTDEFKLQKQIDFLEANDSFVICSHHTKVIDESGATVYLKPQPEEMEFEYLDLLLGRREETRTCSVVIRNGEFLQTVHHQEWYYRTYGTDMFLKLYVLELTQQKIYVMPDVMACYRIHRGGIWSMIDVKLRKRRMVSDFNIVVNHFSYSPKAKRSLLKIYMQQYFLFDLRNLKINDAMNTLISLV